MARGWVKIHRQLLENKLWLDEPFTKGQAWVDLIMLADGYSEGKYKRGSVYRGKEWLSKRWGWSRGKVDRFVNMLEKNHMVKQIKTQGGAQNGTVITIVNYGLYQDKQTQNSTQYRTRNSAPIRSKEESNSAMLAQAEAEEEIGIDPMELMRRNSNGN